MKSVVPIFFGAVLIILFTALFVPVNFFPYQAEVVLAIFTILTHLIVDMPRRMRRLIAGPMARETFGTVPDLSFLLLVANYGLAIYIIHGNQLEGTTLLAAQGVGVVGTIIMLHYCMDALLLDPINKTIKIPVELPVQTKVSNTTRAILLVLRTCVVIISIVGLLSVYMGAIWLSAVAVASLAGLMSGLTVTLKRMTDLSQTTKRQRTAAIAGYFSSLEAQFILYYSAPKNIESKFILSWVKRFQANAVPFFTVVREAHHYKALVEGGITNVIYAMTMTQLEQCLTDSVKLAVYLNTSAKNAQLIRFNKLKQVLIYPGTEVTEALGAYDLLIVRDGEVSRQIEKRGIQTIDNIIVTDLAQNNKPAPFVKWPKPRVLTAAYRMAPVEGDWGLSARICRNLAQAINEYKRPAHLLISSIKSAERDTIAKQLENSMKRVAESTKNGNLTDFHTDAELSFANACRQADVVLLDEISLTFEYAEIGLPIILVPTASLSDLSRLEALAAMNCAYLLKPDFSNLGSLLDVIRDEDPLADARALFIQRQQSRRQLMSLSEALEYSLQAAA